MFILGGKVEQKLVWVWVEVKRAYFGSLEYWEDVTYGMYECFGVEVGFSAILV